MWRGKPDDRELAEYTELKIGDITVFAHESLANYEHLEIDALKFVFWHKLVLRGIPEPSRSCCG